MGRPRHRDIPRPLASVCARSMLMGCMAHLALLPKGIVRRGWAQACARVIGPVVGMRFLNGARGIIHGALRGHHVGRAVLRVSPAISRECSAVVCEQRGDRDRDGQRSQQRGAATVVGLCLAHTIAHVCSPAFTSASSVTSGKMEGGNGGEVCLLMLLHVACSHCSGLMLLGIDSL